MERNVVDELEQMEHCIAACVGNWNLQQDTVGYQLFMRFLQQLEAIVDTYWDEFGESEEQLLTCLDHLYLDVKNKDIIAIGDVLNDELKPIIGCWKKGSDT
jgi:hypothetical protein